MYFVRYSEISKKLTALRAAKKLCELLIARLIRNKWNLLRNKRKRQRFLEIGPGLVRSEGYEALDVLPGPGIDYVYNAFSHLPFSDDTFERVYASHVLEHAAWYRTDAILSEWVRILKPGGSLLVWVPDAFKICEAVVELEKGDPSGITANALKMDSWRRFNPDDSPYLWASGRLFAYGDGDGKSNSPNWHRAMFTRNHLMSALEKAGLVEVRVLSERDILSDDHGWINLGVGGVKP